MRADRRLYLDRSRTRLVAENAPDAAWLLNARGQAIDPVDVNRLGLVEVDGVVMQQAEAAAIAAAKAEPEPEPEPEQQSEAPVDVEPREPIMLPQSRRHHRRK